MERKEVISQQMSEVKWIKITTDMFEDEKIDFIQSLPEADAIIVIWVRLLTMAGKCNSNGYIFLTENIPYDENMLAHKFRKPINIIKLAIETFKRLNMIEDTEKGLLLPNWEKHQNVDGLDKIKEQNRIRAFNYREKIKSRDAHVMITERITQGNATDKELDKDIEKDIDSKDILLAEPTPYKQILNLFNSSCPTLPNIKSIDGNRKKIINTRWRDNSNIEYFESIFKQVNSSDFLSGRSSKWKSSFDWIFNPTNLQKIIEGNYENDNNLDNTNKSNNNSWGHLKNFDER